MAKAKKQKKTSTAAAAKAAAKRARETLCGCPSNAKMFLVTERDEAKKLGAKIGESVCVGFDKRTGEHRARVNTVCSTQSRRYTASTRKTMTNTAVPSSFDYTTPSAVQKLDREAHAACVAVFVPHHAKKDSRDGKVQKGDIVLRRRPLPFRCPSGSAPTGKTKGEQTCRTLERNEKGKLLPIGDIVKSVPDTRCGPTGDPCGSDRTACPVQLVYKAGQPMLRFCTTAGNKKPGWLVPVKNPVQANRIATWACGQWADSGRKFTEKNVAQVLARAAGAGYTGPDNGLGRLRFR